MPRPDPPKEYRWKKGQSGNPNGRPKKKTFEELVEKALDEDIKKLGIVKRELLAQLFVDRLLKQRNKEDFSHYIRRAWPEVAKHEIRGDLDLNHEMEQAAKELEQILKGAEAKDES